ncbi:MAG: hypothetical protein Q4G42_08615 [Neisseria sp.]|nr:hypothetical protein [Neisseria sp.]
MMPKSQLVLKAVSAVNPQQVLSTTTSGSAVQARAGAAYVLEAEDGRLQEIVTTRKGNHLLIQTADGGEFTVLDYFSYAPSDTPTLFALNQSGALLPYTNDMGYVPLLAQEVGQAQTLLTGGELMNMAAGTASTSAAVGVSSAWLMGGGLLAVAGIAAAAGGGGGGSSSSESSTQPQPQPDPDQPVTPPVTPPTPPKPFDPNADYDLVIDQPAAAKEGTGLQYTLRLNATSSAGQVIKITAKAQDSSLDAETISQTADPFAKGEYLGNGTVFTRGVDNMPLAGNSSEIAAFAQSMPPKYNNKGQMTSVNTENFNIPIYIVDSSDPNQYYITLTSRDPRITANSEIVKHTMARIPFPEYGEPDDIGDRSMAVYDKATGMMREYFYVIKPADPNGVWTANSAGYFQAAPGLETLSELNYWMQLTYGSSAVVKMLNPLSQIGISEALAGEINHAVSVTLPDAKLNVISFPAKGSDGQSTDPNAPAQGQWFRFDPNLDLDSLGLRPFTLLVAKAVQKYGGYGADRNAFNFAFNAEAPNNYLAQGKSNPWRTGGEIEAKYGALIMNDFPWHLTQWAPVSWNGQGNDQGVYIDTRLQVTVDGVIHYLPAAGGEITLPAGVTEIQVTVPTLTHNNFKQTDSVTLDAQWLSGSQVLDQESQIGQVTQTEWTIAKPLDTTDGNDIIISPNIDPTHMAAMKDLSGQALIDYIAKNSSDLLKNAPSALSYNMDGGDGDDVLVAGHGVSIMRGGAGKDTFIFTTEHSRDFNTALVDQILDFNPGEDKILLTHSEGWSVIQSQGSWVESLQRFQYHVAKDNAWYFNGISIRTYDGHAMTYDELMSAVEIIG